MFSHYCCSEKVKIKFSHRSKSGYYADNYFYLIKSLSNFGEDKLVTCQRFTLTLDCHFYVQLVISYI